MVLCFSLMDIYSQFLVPFCVYPSQVFIMCSSFFITTHTISSFPCRFGSLSLASHVLVLDLVFVSHLCLISSLLWPIVAKFSTPYSIVGLTIIIICILTNNKLLHVYTFNFIAILWFPNTRLMSSNFSKLHSLNVWAMFPFLLYLPLLMLLSVLPRALHLVTFLHIVCSNLPLGGPQWWFFLTQRFIAAA